MSWLADHLTKKATTIIITIAAVLVVGCWVLYFIFAAPPQPTAVAEQFTIPLGSSQSDVIGSLKAQGFIKNADLFLLILNAAWRLSDLEVYGCACCRTSSRQTA
jgi:cell division protein YceG involved in septum cleavage